MSSVLIIDGKEFVPALAAGKHFGYTKDYLLMLIKQGHIEGQKIGNKWYVNIPSAERHFRVTKAKREVRKKQVSQERKAELREYTKTQKPAQKVSPRRAPFALGVLAVVVIAFSMSVARISGMPQQQAAVSEAAGFFESIARAVYDLVMPSRTEVVKVALPATTSVPMEESAISARVGTTTYSSLIVAPDELFTATTIESIQDSFSDPVTVAVDPENPNTGIITPVFKDGKQGEDYRFLMVPVERNRNGSP
ncbi:hypothetical protein IPH92_05400 [Candidatus Kaiserbacteria bacterium]|nr:MAG: hypothetical protein IPH92_05400 [Candidatus Kaiserbacteria bacterium]